MVPAAVVELDEPHAALGQPPRQQAVRCERAVAAARTIHIENARRLVAEIDQVGHAHLHPEGQLVLRDARGDLGVFDQLPLGAIELGDGLDQVLLRLAAHARRIADVGNRVAPELNFTPWYWLGRKPLNHCRAAMGCACPPPSEVSTMKPGRSSDSLPSP